MTRSIAPILALTATLAFAAPAIAQVGPSAETPLIAHALPIAAGALIGTATSYFILPLIIPALASGATVAGPVVATRTVGAIGAAVGGFAGYSMFREQR